MQVNDDSLCSGLIKNLPKFCILGLTILVLTLGSSTKPQNTVLGDSILKMSNSSTIETSPLISNFVTSGSVIDSINSPLFVKSETLASLSEESIITPTMQAVINCESGGNHIDPKTGKITTGLAGELGIAQFMPATFDWMSGLAGTHGDIYSERDQLLLMRWAFSNGYAYPHWSCYTKIFM